MLEVSSPGAPGCLSQLSIWLRLRSWFRSSWVWAPHGTLCWQLRAWSLLWVLCFLLSLPLPSLLVLSLSRSLSQKEINILKIFKKKKRTVLWADCSSKCLSIYSPFVLCTYCVLGPMLGICDIKKEASDCSKLAYEAVLGYMRATK